MKIGRHPDFVRIVFIMDEKYLQRVTVNQKGASTLEVEFPLPVTLSHAEKGNLTGGAPVEVAKGVLISAKASKSLIALQSLSSFKVHRFSEPSRLAIDAYPTAAPAESPQSVAPHSSPEETLIEFMSVVIDPGHGGYDKGIRTGDFSESDLVLSFAKDLAQAFTKRGKKVSLTRKSDHVLSIRERVNLVRQRLPDAVVSIHMSTGKDLVVYSTPWKVIDGVQGGSAEGRSNPNLIVEALLARSLAQSVLSDLDLEVKHEHLPLSLLAQSPVTAILIELPHPETFRYEGKGRERLVSAVTRGMAHVQAGR
ncbi:MAG: N-acetylmuramoyl-L-alanine amidase [Chloroflexota bacterium]